MASSAVEVQHPLPAHLLDSVRIAWHISSWCNYSCDYCPVLVFHKRSKNGEPRDHAFDHYPVDQWVEAFANFPQKDILLKITGGEPFLDRENFRELLRGVLSMPRYSIQIDTNGSWDPAYFRDVDKTRLSLNVAFHPHMTDFETFFKRVRQMREEGFHVEMLNFVLAPENLDVFARHLDTVERAGFFINLSPMNPTGSYLSRAGRSEREMELIERYNVPIDVKYKVVRPQTKGRPCWHPALSYYLMFDGRIQVYCIGQFQNLFTDGPPALPREAVACTLNECIACTEMYRALADEPLITRPLSLYHRGEYVSEVAEHRRGRFWRRISKKLPFLSREAAVSLREQLPPPPRKPALLPLDAIKPALPPGPVFGSLDATDPIRAYGRDRLYISGWAASSLYGAPIRGVRLKLGDEELSFIQNFYARPDIAATYQREELEQSGWRAMVWLPPLGRGAYHIHAEAIAPDGTTGTLGEIAVEIVG
ncbi:MAG TPA: radical SAM protein [Bryobacteraceae bacterium]|nr:radical SAM protein [Bryobacteraceae bacterium]